MKRRRGTDPAGEPPGNGLDADLGRKKKDKPKPPKRLVANPTKPTRAPRRATDAGPSTAYSVARLILTDPAPEKDTKKPKKPKVVTAKGQKNRAFKAKRQVDVKKVTARLHRDVVRDRDARKAQLDTALNDYERPVPDEVADALIEALRNHPPASGLPPRRPL